MTKDAKDKIFLILYSIVWGMYFLWLYIQHYLPGFIVEKEEWQIFVRGWATIPFLSLGVVYIFEKLREKVFKESVLCYPALIFSSLLFFVIALGLFRCEHLHVFNCDTWRCTAKVLDIQTPSFENAKYFYVPPSRLMRNLATVLFPALQLLVVLVLFILVKVKLKHRIEERIFDCLLIGTPILAGLALLNFSIAKFEYAVLYLGISVVSLAYLFHNRVLNFSPSVRVRSWIDALVMAIIIFAVFDPAFSIDRGHQNPYLGPASDLRLGKALLVNIETTYGILSIYFVNFAMKVFPFSYQGFTLLNTILTVAQYALLYFFLRYMFQSTLFAGFVLLLILEIVQFSTGAAEVIAYPMSGPIRFGLPFLLLFFTMVRYRAGHLRVPIRFMEKATVAVASFWSFEMLVHTWAVYLSIVCFEEYYLTQKLTNGFKNVLKRTAEVIPLALLVFGYFTLDTYLKSGQWPDWGHYINFVLLVPGGNWSTMAVAAWSPWLVMTVVFLGSAMFFLLAIIFRWKKAFEPRMCLALGLTVLGLVQFTYYLGRSHPNNLFRSAWPVICLAAFWVAELSRRRGNASLRKFIGSFIFCAYFAAFFMAFHLWPTMSGRFKMRAPYYGRLGETLKALPVRKPTNTKVAEALALVEKYVDEKKTIPVFIELDDSFEVLILSGKTNVYSMMYGAQIGLTELNQAQVLDLKPPLRSGDIIFISPEALEFQQLVVQDLQNRFKFIERERSPGGIFAIELQSKGGN